MAGSPVGEGLDPPNENVELPAYRNPWPGRVTFMVAPPTGQAMSAAAVYVMRFAPFGAAPRMLPSGALSNGKFWMFTIPGRSCPNVLPPRSEDAFDTVRSVCSVAPVFRSPIVPASASVFEPGLLQSIALELQSRIFGRSDWIADKGRFQPPCVLDQSAWSMFMSPSSVPCRAVALSTSVRPGSEREDRDLPASSTS